MEGVRLYMPGEVPARAFADAVGVIVDVLAELAAHHDVKTGEWVVVGARLGSMAMSVHADGGGPIEHTFLSGVEELSLERRPDGWNDRALRRLCSLPSGRKVPILQVGAAGGRRMTSIDAKARACAKKLAARLPPAEHYGSVIGYLDRPEQLTQTRAVIRDRLTDRLVVVEFAHGHVEEVRRLWGSLVEVEGMILPTASGEPRSVRAEAFHAIGEPVKFSTIFGLLADDPDFDPERYLESVRG